MSARHEQAALRDDAVSSGTPGMPHGSRSLTLINPLKPAWFCGWTAPHQL